MESVVQMGVGGRIGSRALRRHHVVITAADHDEIRLGATYGGKARGLGFQQRTHFQQVVQRAGLRIEQMHQRPGVHL
ncbi:hypothetical protein D3C81_2136010 [compost metagenome]